MPFKPLFILFILLNFATVALSQENYLRVETQFGTFSMTDLKEFQERALPDLGVNIEKLSSFPPYIGYSISFLSYLNPGLGIGLTSEFFSTGGRNYYEDYSGSYKFDLLTHCFNIGTILTIINPLSENQNLNFEISQGLKISSLTLREAIFVSRPLTDEKIKLKSIGWWVKAGLRYEYTFFDYFTAGAFVGGEYNIGSKLESRENPNNYMFKENGDFVKINWTGFRAALSVSVDLSIFSHGRQKITEQAVNH